eukprot:SAG22_NODE_21520_length_256_cov_0.955414_2_plen_50_part_01
MTVRQAAVSPDEEATPFRQPRRNLSHFFRYISHRRLRACTRQTPSLPLVF